PPPSALYTLSLHAALPICRDFRWHRPTSSETRDRGSPGGKVSPAGSAGTPRYREGFRGKSTERRPWSDTDPSKRTPAVGGPRRKDRKSTRLNSSHLGSSYA